jgi:hypothetical protein
VDAAEPPRIVFENPAARCADGRRAEELLKQVLARAKAPSGGWLVTMRVDPSGSGALAADGEIKDEGGATVGHRVVTGKASDCGGLARAIGVWASLVLDAEVNRPPRPVTAVAEEPVPNEQEKTPPEAGPTQADGRPAAATEAQPIPVWPPAPPGEKLPRREDARTLEVGAGGFLMTGITGTGGDLLVGASPFVVVEVARGLFLRPALALGGSVPAGSPRMTFIVSRTDACTRFAGLYTSLHGMQLDICAGGDVGMLDADGRVRAYAAFGPSMDLRGELGGDLAVILRGLVDVNTVHSQHLATPLWAGRGELAMSWRIR